MIRIIGALLLVGGATVIGFGASWELSVRARVLGSFLSALDLMLSEIGSCLTPICELMEKLSKEAVSPLDSFFKACGEEKHEKPDVSFSIIWRKNLNHAEYLKLKTNEREVLSELGAVLGRYDADKQISAISHLQRRVQSLWQSAENDRKSLGKLYAKLGLICGVSVVIVLI